jgi:hypothetical protein
MKTFSDFMKRNSLYFLISSYVVLLTAGLLFKAMQ